MWEGKAYWGKHSQLDFGSIRYFACEACCVKGRNIDSLQYNNLSVYTSCAVFVVVDWPPPPHRAQTHHGGCICSYPCYPQLNTTPSSSLNGFYTSVAWSGFIGDGVPDQRSGNIAVSLCHYILFRNTRHLFLLHLRHIQPPTFITKPYSLLFPREHDCQGSWNLLLLHHNVKKMTA